MSQNLMCDRIAVVIQQNKTLEEECENVKDLINDVRLKKQALVEAEMPLKLPNIYRDFIEELIEKLEVLKLITFDLGKESLDIQSKIEDFERISDTQENLLKNIDTKNCIFEREANEKIHDLRKNYIEKYKELNKFKELYIETENILQETFEKLKSHDKELVEKKKLLAQYKCCIKKLQENVEDENLKIEYEKLKCMYSNIEKKNKNMESILKCIREKICNAGHEIELTMKMFKRYLNIVKEHDCWTSEQMLKRKESLTKNVEKCSLTLSAEDIEIKDLKNRIELINKSVDESTSKLSRLQTLTDSLKQDKLTGRRYINLSKFALKTNKKVVVGRDYMGNTFIVESQ